MLITDERHSFFLMKSHFRGAFVLFLFRLLLVLTIILHDEVEVTMSLDPKERLDVKHVTK